MITFFFSAISFAQQADTLVINKKRLRTFIAAGGLAYGGTLAGLSRLWYENSPHRSFRFFNDGAEWKQVDKFGHGFASYYFSYTTARALQWCNVPEKRSYVVAALTGFLVLVPVEIFDGFSEAYGASAGDLAADAAGASLFLGQQALWNEQRLLPKFSFHQTGYASLRPDVLGDSRISEILKDYNGQTYWLSVNMDRFLTFPRWLNIAVGYGASGMVYARDSQNHAAGYRPYREYYISIEPDLSAIHTRSKLLKTLIFLAGTIKIPAPAIAFSRQGMAFHGLYF